MKTIAILLALFVAAISPAHGAIRLTMTGTVGFIVDDRDIFQGAAVGDPFVASYLFSDTSLSQGTLEDLTINGVTIPDALFPNRVPQVSFAYITSYDNYGTPIGYLFAYDQRYFIGLDADHGFQVTTGIFPIADFNFDLPYDAPSNSGLSASYYIINRDDQWNETFWEFGRLELSAQRVTIAAAPEPMTWTTLIVGFGIVGLALRRRPLHGATGRNSQRRRAESRYTFQKKQPTAAKLRAN